MQQICKLLVCACVLALSAAYLFSSRLAPAEAQQAAKTQRAKTTLPTAQLVDLFDAENPYSAAKMRDLGRVLYYDKRLSVDNTVACADCHDPKFGFTDGRQ